MSRSRGPVGRVPFRSTQFGSQMPKDDTLRPEAIALIKDWIDQRDEWPDELSGDPPAITPDPAAVGMIEAIRRADDRAFTKLLRDARQRQGRRQIDAAPVRGDVRRREGGRTRVDELRSAA